ncbi:hypothetical protein Tco_0562350 [Tanacetum coccineum]
MVPKFRCESLRCHNHEFIEVALDKRQTGEEATISEMEIVYKLDLRAPKEEEKRIEEEQAAKARYWKIPVCYEDNDDEESSIPLKDIIISGLPPCVAITPDSPKLTSLFMVDKHLDKFRNRKSIEFMETESDEFVKSSVENLVQNPSESEDECECDVPDCDDSQTTNFSTYSNPLFDDSTSSDDESSHEEEIHEMSFITYSNPLFDLDEEINSSEFNPIHNEDPDSTPKNDRFDTESYLLESLLNRDTFMTFSPKIDSLLEEFADELALLKPISPEIEDSNPEGDIRLVERLLYDNSTPRPPEAFQANSDTIIESFPTFTIPVEDSDSLREEIDIFPGPDDLIPPGIESDDFDSEDDDNSTTLPEFESFHVDYPDSGDSTNDGVEDILVDVPNILPTHPTLHMDFDFIPSHNDLGSDLDVSSPSGDRNKIYDPGICIDVESTRFLATHSPVIDTFLPFSSENEDKVFNHGVLASKEKSRSSSSHRGFKASKLFHHKSLMLIHGDNTPNLDFPFEQLLNDFMNPPDVLEMDDLESDNKSVDTPLVSPFIDSDDESDDGEVLNELNGYGNAGNFYHNRIINSIDGDDLAFLYMIGFKKFVAYFDLFLPMNIITCKAYNTIMVEGLESARRKPGAIIRDVYMFVGSFTYVTDFVVLEDDDIK